MNFISNDNYITFVNNKNYIKCDLITNYLQILNIFLYKLDINKNYNNIIFFNKLNDIKIYYILPNISDFIVLPNNWSKDEYKTFEILLKKYQQSNLKLSKKILLISENLTNHDYNDCISFFKFIRKEIENYNNIKQQNINYDENNIYISLFNNITTDDNITNDNKIDDNITNDNQIDDNITNDNQISIIFINLNSILKNKNDYIMSKYNNKNTLILFYGIELLICKENINMEDIYLKIKKKINNNNLLDFTCDKYFFCDTNFNWGFSLLTFSNIYKNFFNMNIDELINKLWDDNYYSEHNKKWYNYSKNNLNRTFCNYILNPISELYTNNHNSFEQLSKNKYPLLQNLLHLIYYISRI